jgi:predicted dehydrogenase
MEKFKMAFVGCGSRANQVIYPAFAHHKDVEFCGICDVDSERLKSTAELYNIPEEKRYGQFGAYDYRRMLGEAKPDGVAVIGHPHLMYDAWEWCLAHGFNLYIEKPFALTLHQCRSLVYLAQKNNCTTQVSFQRRSTPCVIRAREECLKRGEITVAMCKFYKYLIEPYTCARDHMMDDAVHAIDTIRWMCGGELAELSSHMRAFTTPDYNIINAMMTFDNGSAGILMNNWTSGKRIFGVEMHAPGIYVEAEHETGAYIYRDGSLEPEFISAEEAAKSGEYYAHSGLVNKTRDFIDCCRSKKPCESDFADAYKTMEIAEKILAQTLLKDK